jgi:hypothetical protein
MEGTMRLCENCGHPSSFHHGSLVTRLRFWMFSRCGASDFGVLECRCPGFVMDERVS